MTRVSTRRYNAGQAVTSYVKALSDRTSILRVMYDVYWAPKGIAVVRT